MTIFNARAAKDETSSTKAETENSSEGEESSTDGWVEVEPSHLAPADLTGSFLLVPYKARREEWGFSFSASYSNFEPLNYTPNFYELFYEDVYSSAPAMPLIELQMTVKYNMQIGSIGGEFAVGMFSAEASNALTPSELELMPIRLGATYFADMLFLEPYVVPYGSIGAYVIQYKESTGVLSFNGFTQVAPYVSGGLQFTLDWIDSTAARDSYLETGVQSTYVFIEGRKFFASSAERDPDFETDLHLLGGLRIEF